MEGNEVEKAAEEIQEWKRIARGLREELVRSNAELTRTNAQLDDMTTKYNELSRKYDDLYRKHKPV